MADPKVIKGLERGLLVLQALQMQPDSSLHELHVVTRISKPSLLRILHTLVRAGLVTRRLGDGRYRTGSTLSQAPSRRAYRDRVAEAAAPVMERLCEKISWPSDLMVPAGDHMEIRETSRKRSPFLLQPERIGLPVNWLWTAVGRAYLAYCPAKERQRIIGLLAGSARPEDRLAREPARCNTGRSACEGLRDTRRGACRRLLRRTPACGRFACHRGPVARRRAGGRRHQYPLAQDRFYRRGVRCAISVRSAGIRSGNRQFPAPSRTSLGLRFRDDWGQFLAFAR
jgi:DNA-binding IclR family transcriptional regulator